MKIFAVLMLLFQVFPFSTYVVDGPSMEPMLVDGDIFLAVKGQEVARDDVVVFSLEEKPDYFYVKRIAALPGDTVMLDGSSIEVPPRSYFVLGDNRTDSFDSRYFHDPFVHEDLIAGRYLTTLFHEEPSDAALLAADKDFVDVTISSKDGSVHFDAQVADDPEELQVGLMYRDVLGTEEGMLFIWPDEAPRTFWMKNTLIPLDMLFFDSQKRLIYIAENSQPCKSDPCELFSSEGGARYVLEINGGLSRRLGINKGDTFTYHTR